MNLIAILTLLIKLVVRGSGVLLVLIFWSVLMIAAPGISLLINACLVAICVSYLRNEERRRKIKAQLRLNPEKEYKGWAITLVLFAGFFVLGSVGQLFNQPRKQEVARQPTTKPRAGQSQVATSEPKREPVYSVVVVKNEDSRGMIIKLRRTVLIIPQPTSEQDVRKTLKEYMQSLRQEEPSGRDVTVGVWVIPSKEHSSYQWYAMGLWIFSDPQPEITVNMAHVPSAQASQGDDVEKRRAIYAELATILDKAGKDAESADPGFGQTYGGVLDQRMEFYRSQFLQKHNITLQQMAEIEAEGIQKSWPQP